MGDPVCWMASTCATCGRLLEEHEQDEGRCPRCGTPWLDPEVAPPMTSPPTNTPPPGTLRRIAAFTDTPAGGNPAGVWIGDVLPAPGAMQAIAAEVGYSETAFVQPAGGPTRLVRYYSPEAEVPFCGHATIALGRALGDADGAGTYRLDTQAGEVTLEVAIEGAATVATLTSVPPRSEPADDVLVDAVLDQLGWSRADLDPGFAPARAFAGAWHLVLAVAARERLADLDYYFEGLRTVMVTDDLTTVNLVWLESPTVVHARNPFPVGGVREDPATGAAAAALGGLLRDRGMTDGPHDLVVHQGHDMGRPSLLRVHVPVTGGIRVSGQAVDLPDPASGA